MFPRSPTITATKRATMPAIASSQKTSNSFGNLYVGNYLFGGPAACTLHAISDLVLGEPANRDPD